MLFKYGIWKSFKPLASTPLSEYANMREVERYVDPVISLILGALYLKNSAE